MRHDEINPVVKLKKQNRWFQLSAIMTKEELWENPATAVNLSD